MSVLAISGAPSGRAAGDALQTRAVTDHGELAAVAAGIALVALEPSDLGGGEQLGFGQTATAPAHRARGPGGGDVAARHGLPRVHRHAAGVGRLLDLRADGVAAQVL